MSKFLPIYFFQSFSLSRLGQYADALEKFDNLQEVMIKNPSYKFPAFEDGYIDIALCHFHLGNLKDAQENFKKAVEYNTNKFGLNSRQLGDCFSRGAKLFETSEQFRGQAHGLYSKAFEIYNNLNPRPGNTHETLISLGKFSDEKRNVEEDVKSTEEWLGNIKI